LNKNTAVDILFLLCIIRPVLIFAREKKMILVFITTVLLFTYGIYVTFDAGYTNKKWLNTEDLPFWALSMVMSTTIVIALSRLTYHHPWTVILAFVVPIVTSFIFFHIGKYFSKNKA